MSRTRGDKHVGTLEEQYGRDFGVRAEMNVETLLQNAGVQSVKQLLDSKLGRKGDGK